MKHETFQNLVANVKRDKGLSSIPFCWFDGTKYHVLSGNHRLKAGIAAGLTHFLVLYDARPLTNQQRIAVQLSHNAIVGEDDAAILKDLWSQIEDVGLKYYAGLDDKTLEQLKKVTLKSLADVQLDYRMVTFMFMPEEEEKLEAALASALKEAGAKATIHLARFADFDRLIAAIGHTKKKHNVKNSAVAMMILLDSILGPAGPETPIARQEHAGTP